MVKRIIETEFWQDEKVLDQFSPEDKYFMMYLLTSPKTTSIGIYKFPKKVAAFDLGYTLDTVNVLLDRFENKYHTIKYNNETQEIAVLNTLKYTISKGGKPVIDMVTREINKVTDSELILAVYHNLCDWWDISDRDIDLNIKDIFEEELSKRKVPKENNANANANANANTDSLHDSSTDSQNVVDSIPYSEIIDYLNEKVGTGFRANGVSNKKYIKARWKEGFRLEDFKKVVDKKSSEWLNTDMAQHLAPKTLFGTKFENYLNQLDKNSNRKNQVEEDDYFTSKYGF
ncbi:replication initiation protein [Streptococcus phage Javan271]|nr:DnaD domain-containing protein [Streptococcus iniae SF1]QBX16692.1 replication initiation protein [Streptococcus phage Javan271]